MSPLILVINFLKLLINVSLPTTLYTHRKKPLENPEEITSMYCDFFKIFQETKKPTSIHQQDETLQPLPP
jgi:hypothetical protein